MLKQRLMTAAILIPLVIWALLDLPSDVVTLLFTIVALLAAWEWLTLTGVRSGLHKTFFVAAIVLPVWLAWMYMPVTLTLGISLGVWCAATLLVLCYAHRPLGPSLTRLFHARTFVIIAMLLILGGFVISAGLLHSQWQQGPALVLYVLVTVWLADSGGYFAGKRFGKHKLAVAISPNKTWEGVYGALLLASVWAIAFHYLFGEPLGDLLSWWLMTLFIVMVSIVGDLLESVFKRSFHVKDSGQLLPGHGGMLDRIDSLLAALPVFTAGLLILGAG